MPKEDPVSKKLAKQVVLKEELEKYTQQKQVIDTFIENTKKYKKKMAEKIKKNPNIIDSVLGKEVADQIKKKHGL